MTIGELREAIKDLPDDMEVDIEVQHYDNGNIFDGVLPHTETTTNEEVEGYTVDKYFSLKCCVFV